MSEYYNGSDTVQYVERATLLEDILLPALPPFPTFEEIEAGDVYYPRTEELYTDILGKFSIPIITPLSDNTSAAINNDISNTSTRNIVNKCNITVSKYQKSNYLELNIPKYIVLNFLRKIPKGTVFIVAFIGGSTDVGDIRIIGVCEYDASSVDK